MNLITPDFGTIFWQTITLIVVLVILKRFAWSKIITTIQNREQSIQGAIESARQAKKQIDLLEEKGKEILSKANIESEQIIKEAIMAKDKIVLEAKNEAIVAGDEMIKNAKSQIEKERRMAIVEIKKDLAGMILTTTERFLEKKLDNEEEQKKLLSSMIEDLPNSL